MHKFRINMTGEVFRSTVEMDGRVVEGITAIRVEMDIHGGPPIVHVSLLADRVEVTGEAILSRDAPDDGA